MKKIYFLILFLPQIIFSQSNLTITNEERAYLYHTIKNSPILDKYTGNYFEYVGPKILFPNKNVNYDSLGTYITTFPDSLKIFNEEIKKLPKGLILEAVNKMILWEMNRMFMAKRGTDLEFEPYKNDYSKFENIFVKHLPPSAILKEDGILIANKKLDNILNPMLSFDDKYIQLSTFQFLDKNDQLLTVKAIYKSINEYVELRTKEIFSALGGEYDLFYNINIGAGDGTITSATYEDRESNEKSKWVMGLPKTFGLIPFQAKYTEGSGAIRSKIDPLTVGTEDYKTAGENRATNIHVDVWGYNPEKQVTVIIEKNGICYPLFNDGTSRFLSPDSSFNLKGGTFKSKMDVLEFNKIKDLNENIYGRRGFDYWIAYNKKMKDKTELIIVKLEKKYSDFGYNPIGVQKKKTKPKKVKRKKNDMDRLENYSLSGNKQDKDRKETQNEIVKQHAIYDEYNRKIKELEIEKKQALELLALYHRRLDDFKLAFGTKWMKYKENKGIYTFEDSTTFNIFTQEFKFPKKNVSEDFEIRLLSIPEECLSNSYDEVMIHTSVIDEIPYYNAKINKQFKNEFASVGWKLNSTIFINKDSLALKELMTSLTKEKKKITIRLNANGIGYWDGSRVIKNSFIGKDSITESNENIINLSELIIENNKTIDVLINSNFNHSEMKFEIKNEKIKAFINENKITNQEIVTLYRCALVFKNFEKYFIESSCRYTTKEEQVIIRKKIDKLKKKGKINIHGKSIAMSEILKEFE